MALIAICLLLGVCVGVMSSVFALGGGIVLVAFLPALLGFSAFQAASTSLLTVFLVSAMNTYFFSRLKLIRWQVGLLMGVPSATMAIVSGKLAVMAGEAAVELVVFLMLIAILVSSFLKRHSLKGLQSPKVLLPLQKVAFAGIGSAIGLVAAFSGLGGGAMMTPVLSNFKLVREEELVPTANLTTCLTTFTGCIGYFLLQGSEERLIDYKLALGVFAVATVTSHFARPFQKQLAGSTKILVICTILVVVICQVGQRLYLRL